MFKVTDDVLELPALSVTVAEITWPVPSVLTDTGAGQFGTPERLSEQA